KEFKIMSLHGQSKDAIAKLEKGSWEYDIKYAGYKYNMTDIQASLGLVHLSEYGDNIAKRRSIFNTYNEAFSSIEELILPGFNGNEKVHSAHLYPLRVRGYTLEERASLIENLYSAGIHSNVHFKPIPLLTAYSKKFNIKDFPNAMEMYTNEISLPIYPSMTDDDVQYVIDAVIVRIKE
ncbi:MAG: DegT/DnrJ/EryC1/StrS family aminotransferase, partial [Spirochaetes bacterium]|nr:DegT/DnrJ/EryC1/StrS family aminotransferase [Spirochaetota bacterium]